MCEINNDFFFGSLIPIIILLSILIESKTGFWLQVEIVYLIAYTTHN